MALAINSRHVFLWGKITWDFRRKDNGNNYQDNNHSRGTNFLELNQLYKPVKPQPWRLNDVAIPHPTLTQLFGKHTFTVNRPLHYGRRWEALSTCRLQYWKLWSPTQLVIKLFLELEFCLQLFGNQFLIRWFRVVFQFSLIHLQRSISGKYSVMIDKTELKRSENVVKQLGGFPLRKWEAISFMNLARLGLWRF